MSEIQWTQQPRLDRPMLIGAFGGWNDAGEAASNAIRWLIDRWEAERFASINPEEFMDFSMARPNLSFSDDGFTAIEWPQNDFYSTNEHFRDVVLLSGTEPQLKWRNFCQSVIDVADTIDASSVLLLGSSLSDVPHSRPAPVLRHSTNNWFKSILGKTQTPEYRGPAGITSVLHSELEAADIPVASLWTSIPHYIGHIPSPKATLSLLEVIAELFSVTFDTLQLQAEVVEYQAAMNEFIEDDDEMIRYVRELEIATDETIAMDPNSPMRNEPDAISLLDYSGESLSDEAARYLRDHN